PWLKTRKDIMKLVSLGRPDYAEVLSEDFVIALPETPLSNYWVENECIFSLPVSFLQRDLFDEVLYERIPLLQEQRIPLVLNGESGHGKTVFLGWLANQKSLTNQFERVICIRGSKDDELYDWLRSIHYEFFELEDAPENVTGLTMKLKQSMYNRKTLFLLDNCHEPRLLERVQDLLTVDDFAVLTTLTNAGVAESVPALSRFYIPPFEFSDLVKVCANEYDHDLSRTEMERLSSLFQILEKNMHAMRSALARTASQNWNWIETIEHLRNAPSGPEEMNAYIYKALYVAYQDLEPDLQRVFRYLGALPMLVSYDVLTFVGLWNVSFEEAKDFIEKLKLMMDIFDNSSDGTVRKIREGAIQYAHYLLEESLQEQKDAEKWLDRVVQIPEHQSRNQEIKDTLPRVSFLNRWNLIKDEKIPYRHNLLSRSWRKLTFLYEVRQWEIIRQHSRGFTSVKYTLGYTLRHKALGFKPTARKLIGGLILIIVMILVAEFFSIDTQWIVYMIIAMIFCLFVVVGWVLRFAWKMDTEWIGLWKSRASRDTS
ncbi:MAG: NB-ARC domain-containing protein, partial [Chloroflexota bacterium]|nr:NB-ARC domain-containing protein [Chloroflexota bacterium]